MSNEIDNIFSDKTSEEITTDIKNRRKKLNSKLIIKSVAVTLGLLIVLYGTLSFGSKQYAKHSFNNLTTTMNQLYTISYPNTYISDYSYNETGLFKYSTSFPTGKKIGNNAIYAGTNIGSTSLLSWGAIANTYITNPSIDPLDKNIDNRYIDSYGLRELTFINPNTKYAENINDFHYLSEIDKTDYVEFAISFDKEYSYEEVNKLFNSNLVSFYWIDNTEDTSNDHTSTNFAIGVKSHTPNGKFISDTKERLSNFKNSVEYFESGESYGLVDNIDKNNFKISGIIVQGTPEELDDLENNSAIKHAVMGNVVNKY